jgi:hypothetical protein
VTATVVKTGVFLILLLLLSLLVGTMFGIWAGYDPATLSFGAFVEQHQNAVRRLNVLLPTMGSSSIALTFGLAFMFRRDPIRACLLLAAAGSMVVAALVTHFGNQPINAIIMTWDRASAPDGWMPLRDQWWTWHRVRLAAGTAALVLALLAALRSGRENHWYVGTAMSFDVGRGDNKTEALIYRDRVEARVHFE